MDEKEYRVIEGEKMKELVKSYHMEMMTHKQVRKMAKRYLKTMRSSQLKACLYLLLNKEDNNK